MYLRSIIAILLSFAFLQARSQVAPSASDGGKFSLSAGGGFSAYNVDWGRGHMQGGTLWVDFHPYQLPKSVYGLGIELEARDISLGGNSTQPSNFRLDTYGGGVIYSWPRFRRVRPYAKIVMGLGAIDWNNPSPNYKHETRSVYAPGGGVDYRVFGNIEARVDYEYQIWPDMPYNPGKTVYFDPQGFTVGVLYNFKGTHFNR